MLRKLKQAMLQSPIVLAAPMQTRLEKRPFTQTILSPQGFQLDTVQKVALGLLVIPTAIGFLSSLFSAAWPLFFITGFLLLLCGFMVWIIRLRSQMVWKVTWYKDMVEVEDGRYGPPERWREPLAAFTGLVQDFGLIRSRNQYALSKRVYGLLLAHPDPFKSILLHASREKISGEIVAYYEGQLGKKLMDV